MNKHEEILEELVKKLSTKNKRVILHQKYYIKDDLGLRDGGEFDAFEHHYDGHGREWWTYYEIKSFYSLRTLKRALKQFEHAKKAFPNINWHFVLVTPQKIRHYTIIYNSLE